VRALALLPLLFASPSLAQPDSLRADIAKDMPGLVTIYRDLHANPELSGQEKRTSAILAAEAKKAGFEVTTGVGGYGVVAVM
jgi:hippurate hydrolase